MDNARLATQRREPRIMRAVLLPTHSVCARERRGDADPHKTVQPLSDDLLDRHHCGIARRHPRQTLRKLPHPPVFLAVNTRRPDSLVVSIHSLANVRQITPARHQCSRVAIQRRQHQCLLRNENPVRRLPLRDETQQREHRTPRDFYRRDLPRRKRQRLRCRHVLRVTFQKRLRR